MLSILQRRETGLSSPAKLYDVVKANKNFVQRLRLDRQLEVHRGCVNTICWNESGTSILSGSDDQHLVVSDPYTGKTRASIRSGHHSNIFCAKFLPASQDQEIVSCSGAGSIYYTQVEREDLYGKCLFDCHTGTTYELVVVPNEARTFLTCGEDGTVRWFDLRIKTSCNKERCKEDVLINCRSAVTSISVDPVLPYQLATACADGSVRVFDRRMLGTRLSGAYSSRLMTGLVSRFLAPLENQAHRITSLNYSPFSHDVLVSYSAENVYLFNTQLQDSKEFSKTDQEAEAKGSMNGDEASGTAAADPTNQPPTKRLRLRGDWSDTGPNARPERERTEDTEGLPQVNLMQRMSDMLTRWLDGSMRRRGDDQEGSGAPSADNPQEGADNSGTVPADAQNTSAAEEAREGDDGGERERATVTDGPSSGRREVWRDQDQRGDLLEVDEDGRGNLFEGGGEEGGEAELVVETGLDLAVPVSGSVASQAGNCPDCRGFTDVRAEHSSMGLATDATDVNGDPEGSDRNSDAVTISGEHQFSSAAGRQGSSVGVSAGVTGADSQVSMVGHALTDFTQPSQSVIEEECVDESLKRGQQEETVNLSRLADLSKQGGTGAVKQQGTKHSQLPLTLPHVVNTSPLAEQGRERSHCTLHSHLQPPSTTVPHNVSSADRVMSSSDSVVSPSDRAMAYSCHQDQERRTVCTSMADPASTERSGVESTENDKGAGLEASGGEVLSASSDCGQGNMAAVTTAVTQSAAMLGQGISAPTRLEPVISLHYSDEGTTASTIQVAYASFNIMDPPHSQVPQETTASPLVHNPNVPTHGPSVTASLALTPGAASLPLAATLSSTPPHTDTLNTAANVPPCIAHSSDSSRPNVSTASVSTGCATTDTSIPLASAALEASPLSLDGGPPISVSHSPLASVPTVSSSESSVAVVISSSMQETAAADVTAVTSRGDERSTETVPTTYQEQGQQSPHAQGQSQHTHLESVNSSSGPQPPRTEAAGSTPEQQPSTSATSSSQRETRESTAGNSGARQRRVGHSGPPTGDFQLVLNENSEEDSDDEDDSREGIRSRSVPFWSYGASSNDERHYAAMCMQSMYRRRMQEREKQAMAAVFQPQPLRMYTGHRNSRTMIKESNFWGDSVVMSGSDCGRIFLWERDSTQLIMLLEADRHVVNCLQPHPFDPILASSGIDYDVKIWSPLEAEPRFDSEMAEEVMRRNQIMLEETRDTITVPAAFMLRVLASLNQIRAGRAGAGAGRQQEDSPGDSD